MVLNKKSNLLLKRIKTIMLKDPGFNIGGTSKLTGMIETLKKNPKHMQTLVRLNKMIDVPFDKLLKAIQINTRPENYIRAGAKITHLLPKKSSLKKKMTGLYQKFRRLPQYQKHYKYVEQLIKQHSGDNDKLKKLHDISKQMIKQKNYSDKTKQVWKDTVLNLAYNDVLKKKGSDKVNTEKKIHDIFGSWAWTYAVGNSVPTMHPLFMKSHYETVLKLGNYPKYTVLHFKRLRSDRRSLTPKHMVVAFFRSSRFRNRVRDIMRNNLAAPNASDFRVVNIDMDRDLNVNVTVATTGMFVNDLVGALKHHYSAGGVMINSKGHNYELTGYSRTNKLQ
jgi:hypothetical protein